MLVKGTVEKVIYRNAENGYSVMIISDSIISITAVGVVPPISEGEVVELEGDMISNPKYGEQLRISSAKVCLPDSLDSIAKYLSSGLFKGIGEVTADNIVDEFGEKTFEIIEKNPSKLTKAKGMSLSKAMQLHESFLELKDMQNTMVGLQKLDISLNLALKIYKIYGNSTLSIVNENPYKLVEDVDGIGFVTADRIAREIGIQPDSEFRIRAGMVYVLKQSAGNNGHTYLPKEELYYHTFRLLSLDKEEHYSLFESVVEILEISGVVVVLDDENGSIVMFNRYYLLERKISERLIALSNSQTELHTDIRADISEFEELNGLKMHENQVRAIENAIRYGVNIITGGPGTGKTTIIKCILHIFKKLNLNTQLCAPTGRASKRLAEACGEDAKTIHRLLDLDFKNGKGYFTYCEETKLDADVIIVDEVSMCDEYVFSALLGAIKYGGRLIVVGDKDQLPSVGAGNILGDIIAFGKLPVSYLTYIYRQEHQSMIVENAHRINNGEMPIIRNSDSDFLFSNIKGQENVASNVVDMVARRIPDYMNVSPTDIQVLCPLKKGVSGVNNLNVVLQNAINPHTDDKKEIKMGEHLYRQFDKVIHIVNNYDLEWTRGDESGVGVFNGDIGKIIDVDESEGKLIVEFEDERVAVYTRDIFDQLLLAYAISVHKSQGSEFDIAVIVLMGGSYTLMTRNLLYTAVTRAKKMSVLVGDEKHLYSMVHNNYTAKRYTLLTQMLLEEYQRQCLN
ncbi:MAG: ATP-dependent RecD-like DNA helicase [Clostridia bacterium]|nr:ATP-dependent RecD-like DNA helicase [Clostridia bacterium]